MKLRTFFAFAAFLAASFAFGDTPTYEDHMLVVKFKAAASPWSVRAAHARIGARVERIIPGIRAHVLRLPNSVSVEQAAAYYKRNRMIQYAEPNYKRFPRLDVDDPQVPNQYSLEKMSVFDAWDISQGDPLVKIAIIDTGIDMNHPDLASKIVNPWNQADGTNNPEDFDSHGSHCAGIAAAATNNGIGMAGVGNKCRIMPIKFNFTVAGSAESIVRAADTGAQVISMSYGGPGTAQAEQEAVEYAHGKGVVLLGAAGNANSSDPNEIGFPASFPNVISVGATNSADVRAGFSNFGPLVDIAAPGDSIYSTIPDDDYANFSGTSMACPNAAGVVGLMMAVKASSVTNDDVRTHLQDTTDFVGTWVNTGRINAFEALSAVPKAIIVEEPVPPVFLGVWEGTPTTASSRVLVEDDVYFTVNPKAPTQFVGNVASAFFKFTMPVPRDELVGFEVQATAHYTAGGTGQLFLWNWVNNRWDNLKSFPLGADDRNVVAALRKTNVSTYVSANTNEVRVLVRGILPVNSRYLGGAPLAIDFLEVLARWEEDL